jgi:hypothetical protein
MFIDRLSQLKPVGRGDSAGTGTLRGWFQWHFVDSQL